MSEQVSLPATRALAHFAATAPLDSVPTAVRQRLKECLLDFIGNAAFAAAFAESSPAFRAGAAALAGGPCDITVVGEANGMAFMSAALLNGAYAHTLDFDDTNAWGSLHPGAPVIAAAMVEAERVKATGSDWLVALAVGYEVACRVGAALGNTAYDRGFHITGVAGIFGAVAAAGRLRGLNADTMASAFGVALSKSAASMQYLENGSWNKRLHPGFAAHDAMVAIAFAQAGVEGADAALEGRYGLLMGYTNAPRPALLTERLGQWWPSGETAIKPYPSCRFTHGAAEVAIQLHERCSRELREEVTAALRAGARVQLRLSPKAVQIVGERLPNKVHPRNIVDAQFSVYFQVAVAWLDGRCNWQGYQRIGDPDVEALCAAIDVTADPDVAIAGAALSLGTSFNLDARVDDPLGEDSNPFTGAPLRRKFDDLAVPVYGGIRASEIANRVAALEQEIDTATLIRSFRRSMPS
ncbi:MAG: MmgE/PrpD family protein [Rhodoferax sp.]